MKRAFHSFMGNTSVGQAEGLTMSLGMACCWMRVGDVKFISARAEAHSGLEAELMQAWSRASVTYALAVRPELICTR